MFRDFVLAEPDEFRNVAARMCRTSSHMQDTRNMTKTSRNSRVNEWKKTRFRPVPSQSGLVRTNS